MTDTAILSHTRRGIVTNEQRDILSQFMHNLYFQCPNIEDLIWVCIGTDQSTGDAFGPLVGTRLYQLGFKNVIGTLEQPCDAYRVEQEVKCLQKQTKTIIAIDACLGLEKQVGQFLVKEGPILPGAATGRRLPEVGDYSVAAVVNELGPKAYWKIQTTSLYVVLELVETFIEIVSQTWNLDGGRQHEYIK